MKNSISKYIKISLIFPFSKWGKGDFRTCKKWIMIICSMIAITFLFVVSAVCIENQNNNTYTQSYDGFGESVRLIASLLFVLALIIGGVYLLNKVPLYKRFVGSAKPISLLSSISLGHKRSISVVRVADEILILGLTNTNVSILSKMKANEYFSSENVVSITTDIQNNEISGSDKGFLEQLKKAIRNRRFK